MDIGRPKKEQQSSVHQETVKVEIKYGFHSRKQLDSQKIPINDLFESTIDEYDQLMH